MKSYNGTSDVGNIFIISENTHPACLVQAEIETRIKDNTKIFLISNEGENEYIEHCKALQGEQISLLNIDSSSLKNSYTVLDIVDSDRLQADFSDRLYNALHTIWEKVQSESGKSAIYLNNIYSFFDAGYRTSECINLLVNIFSKAKQNNCSIVVFNWKPVDFTKKYGDGDIDYTSKIFNNVMTFVITAIQDYENMRIISDVFHLTENEENLLKSLKSNEGMSIANQSYELIYWEK